MIKELNTILHSQLRLSIMSILISVEESDFNFLKEKTNATAGNLSVHLEKLSEAQYIEIKKGFLGKRPRTTCKITPNGITAFEEYFAALQEYMPKK